MVFFNLLAIAFLLSATDAKVIYQDLYLIPSYQKAHGICMGLSFVVFYPVGAILIRTLKFKGSIWVHIACQLVGWLLMIAGLAFGVKMGKIIDILHKQTHTILGTVVVVAMLLQPFFGLIHHLRFRKTQQRTAWTEVHVWYGRILIILGIINGGLGIQLARTSGAGRIVYAVFGGLSGAALCVMAILIERDSLRKSNNIEKVERAA